MIVGRNGLHGLLVCTALLLPPSLLAQTRIVGVGDSITLGFNQKTGSSGGPNDGYFPHLDNWLRANFGEVTLINSGVNGESSGNGRVRLPVVLFQTAPDIVLIMYGTNDVTVMSETGAISVGLSRLESNLQTMISDTLNEGLRPIVATVIPRSGDPRDPNNNITRQANARIRAVAASRGVAVADQEANFTAHNSPVLYSDPIHPSSLGYTLLAEAFASAISGTPVSQIDLLSPQTGTSSSADVNGSGVIDGPDLILIGLAFGSSQGQPRYRAAADVDGNRLIDGADLSIVAAQFGFRL